MKSVTVMRWVFMVVGVGMLGIAGWLYEGTRAFVARATTADGTVVGLARSGGSKSTWRPVVRFELHVFHSRNLWFDPTKYVGDRRHVTVFVERGNPKRYHLDVSFLPKLAE